jgi:TolB-like protein
MAEHIVAFGRTNTIAPAPAALAIQAISAVRAAEVEADTPRLSVVVLPFDNLSGDSEQECFVDGGRSAAN